MSDDEKDTGRGREHYEKGLPGYHDVLGRLTGAPPALSALTLRLWLAAFGAVFCLGSGVTLLVTIAPLRWFGWLLVVLGVVAVVDLAWVAHRKRRGEPG
ncbi:hypothetical protein [Actinopolyspora mortivallis]|uniref:Uncharacterized protein n=1 Tax=Actinopolyspora mortivallis TaxID=33906 RepID=A0A2T0GY49_ACTMO|nr:hypothetical protein [Actinopolyspora mortivallis]PRW64031.1 hypothetical protein CEP50_07510 [Actinopolyspora mortivallis]